METLRHRLRQLRKEKGWTLKKTQKESGVPFSYLSAIENGRRRAGRRTIHKLVGAYVESEEDRDRLWNELLQLPQFDRQGGMDFPPLYKVPNEYRRKEVKPEPVISSKTVAREVEDFLQVLGLPLEGNNPTFPLVDKSDREFQKNGREIRRVFVVAGDNEQFAISISVCRLESTP